MHYAAENLIPVTLELGGKSPNIFFADVLDAEDDSSTRRQKASRCFALHQGEVCTCPARALVQEPDLRPLLERAIARVRQIVEGDPLDPSTRTGAQLRGPAGGDPELHRHREAGGREDPDRRRRRVHRASCASRERQPTWT